MIGDINGATSIAPMIMAGESVINPMVAMLHESTTSRKKSKLDEELSVISSMICFRSSLEGG